MEHTTRSIAEINRDRESIEIELNPIYAMLDRLDRIALGLEEGRGTVEDLDDWERATAERNRLWQRRWELEAELDALLKSRMRR